MCPAKSNCRKFGEIVRNAQPKRKEKVKIPALAIPQTKTGYQLSAQI